MRQVLDHRPVRPLRAGQHRPRAAERQRHDPRRRRHQPRRGRLDRLQRTLRAPRPVRRRAARAGRVLPQRLDRRRDPAGDQRLPQLRLARGPRRDVAVRRGLPRPQGRLRRARHPGHRRQRQPLQPDRRDGHPPTPVVAVLGVIEDVTRRTPTGFQAAGHQVLLLGETREELSGSEWAHVVHGHLGGTPPRVDLAAERALSELLAAATGCCPRRTTCPTVVWTGTRRVLPAKRRRCPGRARYVAGDDPFVALFSESAARVLVTVSSPEDEERLFELAAETAYPSPRSVRRTVTPSRWPALRRTPRGAARRLDRDPPCRPHLVSHVSGEADGRSGEHAEPGGTDDDRTGRG